MGIKIENIFYTYNKKASNSTLALDDVSFSISDNDFVAIVGETGSGKSTLAQTFNALFQKLHPVPPKTYRRPRDS